jgi:CheY-like chemotaxis protein
LEVIRGLHGACLVLLDLQMPVMTGEQLLEALKSEPSAVRNVPVVVISARNEPPQSRVQAFLRKPIDIEKLLEIVSKLTFKS